MYDFCDSLEMEELERFLTLFNAEADAGPEYASDADKKSHTIGELLGVAMGAMGMSLSDFCALSPSDFRTANKSFLELEEARSRDCWEKTRMLATIAVQPYSRKRLDPRSLLPLPWDRAERKSETTEASTPEKFKAMLEKYKKSQF